ncbi:putative membrane protein YhhN [Chryseobacterium bernardetii]|uniref:Membrane protein YhhN n=3 Tax=Chryseobacterium TaxID=59732 RepID=A0ACC6IUZ5_9FLAO|nr:MULTISPECIES: lysoplasmalogenase [Chryseobacterium]MDR6441331.1 putative membrane protein YhhN [Chryseobacterium bernardetii]TQM20914.1 putative membrane protein YhhN [Chryseobacterium aquifrigidense]
MIKSVNIKLLLVLLAIVFTFDLVFIAMDHSSWRFFTKPLLLPIIIWFYFTYSQQNVFRINQWFLSGLILSFLGDVFLLFEWGFMPGLGSFLLAHICYIVYFFKIKKKNAWSWLPFVFLYLGSFLYYIYPYLNDMKIPVVIYGITIAAMLYFSISTYSSLLILGAILFVISDSVLAINMFVQHSTEKELVVMITYVLAQLMLVSGVVGIEKKNRIIQ